jgi:hypothetical protein
MWKVKPKYRIIEDSGKFLPQKRLWILPIYIHLLGVNEHACESFEQAQEYINNDRHEATATTKVHYFDN